MCLAHWELCCRGLHDGQLASWGHGIQLVLQSLLLLPQMQELSQFSVRWRRGSWLRWWDHSRQKLGSAWNLDPDGAVSLILLAAVLLPAEKAPGNDENHDGDDCRGGEDNRHLVNTLNVETTGFTGSLHERAGRWERGFGVTHEQDVG